MLIIPTIGWGKEYVVAAYCSLFEGYGTLFTIILPSSVLLQTRIRLSVTIIRMSILRCQNGVVTVHKAHVPFTGNLNRGECIQYKAVLLSCVTITM